MANYFQEEEARPIVSAWIEQGFEIDRGFILEAIEHDESALSQDVTLSAVAAFGSIASGCLMLALAGFSAPMLIPVGVVVGAGLVAWNSDCAKSDRELEGKFLRDYPSVFDRINQRVSSGEGVAKIAGEYGQMFRAYRKSDRAALSQLTATASTENQTQSGIQNQASMDAPRTESAALAVTELQPIAHGLAAAAAPSMSMVNGVETIAPRDIATDLGNNPQSALIFGTPGAGKGMNISNAIRTLRAKLPNVTVMMVDPKGDKKERGYWESQVDIFESRSLLKSSPRSSAEWMLRCVEKFTQIDGPKLLVWDELFASITVLKGQNVPKGEDAFPCLTDFQQFISLNLSLGPSSGIWVWGMSQSANLSDLGLTSGGLSTTRIIALISPDNVGAVEGYLATKAITAPKGGMETLDRLMEQSPVGRACYDGKTKRWYPTARLENHSGFDRDSADWNNLGKVAPSSAPETRSPQQPTDEWDGVPEVECDGPDADQWDLIERFSQETGQGYFNNPNFDSWLKKQTYVNGKAVRVSSGKATLPGQTIEVETSEVDDTPDGLESFPLVLTIWQYLDGKDARSFKQINDAMRAKGKIPEDILMAKVPHSESYRDALKSVVAFGVGRGFLAQVSEDTYGAIRKQ